MLLAISHHAAAPSLLILTLLSSGCYLSHGRVDPPVGEEPPSACPIPSGGPGATLMLLHERDGARALSRVAPDGAAELVTDALGPSADRLTVVPGGQHAVVGASFEGAVLIAVATGDARPLVDLAPAEVLTLCAGASMVVTPRPDGRALLVQCTKYAAVGREAAGAWELNLETLSARTVATDCAQALYARNSPCDMHVTWGVCPGPDDESSLTHGELRRLDGSVRPLPGLAWVLSPSSYLMLRDGPPSSLVVVDSAGSERDVFAGVDTMRPLSYGVLGRSPGSAVVFDSDYGYGLVSGDDLRALAAPPCGGSTHATWPHMSGDGQSLVVACSDGWRWASVDLEGGAPRALPMLEGVAGQIHDWSADGRFFLLRPFVRDDTLALLVSRDGSAVVELAPEDPVRGTVLDVSLAYQAAPGW